MATAAKSKTKPRKKPETSEEQRLRDSEIFFNPSETKPLASGSGGGELLEELRRKANPLHCALNGHEIIPGSRSSTDLGTSAQFRCKNCAATWEGIKSIPVERGWGPFKRTEYQLAFYGEVNPHKGKYIKGPNGELLEVVRRIT